MTQGVGEGGHDITGALLVGGFSRRLGRDKAFVGVGGRPLFERVLQLFRESFDRVLLVGNRPERFAGYPIPFAEDLYSSALGGIYTALSRAETEYVFISSCDLPFPSRAVLERLVSLRHGFDAVVPRSESGCEPLFALYGKRCLAPVAERLAAGDCRIRSFYPLVRTRYLLPVDLSRIDPEGLAFLNVNTHFDLARARFLERMRSTEGELPVENCEGYFQE